jgi:hypothetical protein
MLVAGVARGQLIAESLKIGERFHVRGVRLLGATRVQPPEERLRPDQPRQWTFIGFEMDDKLAPAVADALAAALDGERGWYCNFSTTTEAWVIYRGRVFHYPIGDPAGRTEAQAYGRSLGVPEPQLDWGE